MSTRLPSKTDVTPNSAGTVTTLRKPDGEPESGCENEASPYPAWRREELARKYSDEYREERHERSFYHPYG